MDLNHRRSALQADALPLSYQSFSTPTGDRTRISRMKILRPNPLDDRDKLWKQKDSNLRTPKRAVLQTAAVAAWLYFQFAHRSFICEEYHNNRLTVAYGPSVTLDCSFIAPRGGLEPPTIALTGRRSTY